MATTQQLRILTFIHSFEPGGVERVALRLVQAWKAAGHDAPVLLGRDTGAMRAAAPALDYLPTPRGARWTGWFETLWMIFRLRRAVARIGPDVLFCPGNTYTVVAVSLKLLLGRRCPPIVAKISNDLARRDLPWPARRLYRGWLRVQARAIDRFVAMIEPMRAEIAAAMRIDERRVAVIENPALDEEELEALRAAGAKRVASAGRRFLAIGRLTRQKNFALLLRAFAEGAGPQDSLALLGEGPERKRLERLCARLGLADRVIMPGHCTAVDEAMRAADVLLLSSDYEGVPGVVIEALAAGLAIVATDCSVAMPALIECGRLGKLVPRGDAAAFARAIADAAPPPVDRAAAARQAARFTVASAAPAYLALLAETVRDAAAGRDCPSAAELAAADPLHVSA